MEVIHERCAGIDISKRDAKVCLRLPGKRVGTYTRRVTTWGGPPPVRSSLCGTCQAPGLVETGLVGFLGCGDRVGQRV
jgi:hypothetical protein